MPDLTRLDVRITLPLGWTRHLGAALDARSVAASPSRGTGKGGGPTMRAAIDAFLDTPKVKKTPNTLRAYTNVLDRTAEQVGSAPARPARRPLTLAARRGGSAWGAGARLHRAGAPAPAPGVRVAIPGPRERASVLGVALEHQPVRIEPVGADP